MIKQRQVEEISNIIYDIASGVSLDECKECATKIYNVGYCKKKELVKEILQRVMGYTLEDEHGMKYLINKLAEEYGVKL